MKTLCMAKKKEHPRTTFHCVSGIGRSLTAYTFRLTTSFKTDEKKVSTVQLLREFYLVCTKKFNAQSSTKIGKKSVYCSTASCNVAVRRKRTLKTKPMSRTNSLLSTNLGGSKRRPLRSSSSLECSTAATPPFPGTEKLALTVCMPD
ncbi:hypothetical protein GQX74_002131 [Glossina fuscipes]|nr:hypothetical protein GQX74_002131 [Glossina fuscipes]